jgi:hypothetical protein
MSVNPTATSVRQPACSDRSHEHPRATNDRPCRFQRDPSLKQTLPKKNENADNRKRYADQKN